MSNRSSVKSEVPGISSKTRKVALVGNPNVGKSVLFNALTGAYVTSGPETTSRCRS